MFRKALSGSSAGVSSIYRVFQLIVCIEIHAEGQYCTRRSRAMALLDLAGDTEAATGLR